MPVRSRRYRTRFDLSRSLTLDRLLESEILARDTWAKLETARVRWGADGYHPMLEELVQHAWKTWHGIAGQRESCERAWRVPA